MSLDGEVVQELLPLNSEGTAVTITPEQLGQLLLTASLLAFQASEKTRQYYARTPDGLRDKTIHNYKRVPYHTALSQSSSIQDIPLTGTETWQGDSINPIPASCAERLFLDYPHPLLLSERCHDKEEK